MNKKLHRENREGEKVETPTCNPQLKGGGKHLHTLLAVFLAVTVASNTISLAVPSNVFLPEAHAQGIITETVKRRNLVIDLGDGLKTDAQLTFPAVGDGPFPGVLLIHGSGNIDMDGYLSPQASNTEEGSRILLQIAEYLTERGFAVLRYNKRSVGLNGAILDVDVFMNMTVHDLIRDAEKALEVLMQQSEVDASDITIIGHSEGTTIAPRIAIKNPSIRNIVLMGVSAHNVYDMVYWQTVDRSVSFGENVLDTNFDGLISIQEVLKAIERGELFYETNGLIQNITGQYDWIPGFDADKDGYCSIQNELKPTMIQYFDMLFPSDPTSPNYWPWLQSHRALKETNLDLIGNVSASILILHGEGEIQCPVEQAFLLEQRLMEINHPDHTLITYPGLGHSFYPAKGLVQPLGPIQDYVLMDLAAWLKDPERDLRILYAQLQTAEETIYDFQVQLDELSSELDQQTSDLESQVEEWRSEHSSMQSTLTELKGRYTELQSALDLSKNIAYIAIGIAIIAVVVAAITLRKR